MSEGFDSYTKELFDALFKETSATAEVPAEVRERIGQLFERAKSSENLTQPIVDLFLELLNAAKNFKASPEAFGIKRRSS